MNRFILILASLTFLLAAPALLAEPDGDHELVGTVTAMTDTMLTIETIQGQQVSFEITAKSLLPDALSVGDKVSVNHRRSSEGSEVHEDLHPITEVLIADDVDLDLNNDVDVDLDTESEMSATVEVESDLDTQVQVEMDDPVQYEPTPQRYERLPQTASPLAALALVGLTALGSAVFVRRNS